MYMAPKDESMIQLQYPYQLIMNHPVFHPTISKENFSLWNPRAVRAHKQYQNIAVERYKRQVEEDKFHFLSIPLMVNSIGLSYLAI